VSTFVVDASIAIKWFLTEPYDESALRLLTGGHTLSAPDLIYSEVANILWKRVRRDEMSEVEATCTLQGLGAIPLLISELWPLVVSALAIACRTQRSAYDSLYLALAVREKCQLVTADRKLYNAIRDGPLSKFVVWVENIP
jgi:predicted nucleic acid-binding protein